jgi:hypothetical protein
MCSATWVVRASLPTFIATVAHSTPTTSAERIEGRGERERASGVEVGG